jgi:hypothetical protein
VSWKTFQIDHQYSLFLTNRQFKFVPNSLWKVLPLAILFWNRVSALKAAICPPGKTPRHLFHTVHLVEIDRRCGVNIHGHCPRLCSKKSVGSNPARLLVARNLFIWSCVHIYV